MKALPGWLAALVFGALLGYGTWRLVARSPEMIGDDSEVWTASSEARPGRRIAVETTGSGGAVQRVGGAHARDNNRAVELLDAGDVDGAIALLEACVAAAPGEPVFASNLAEALARRAVRDHASPDADRAFALADLGRAAALDTDRADLAELLVRWRAAAEVETDFAAYGSNHFELAFDGNRGEILRGAQGAIDVLERAYGEFTTLFQHDPLENGQRRIRVVLTTRAEFERSTGLGHWAGGAFDGTLRLPIEDFEGGREGWSQVLRHELLHLFIQEVGGARVPGWLNEGLAQWVEETRARDLERAHRALVGERLLGLDDLSAPLARLSDPARIGLAYRQSLAFVDHLMGQYGEWLVLQLVARAGRGAAVEVSFRELAGVELADVLAQFSERFAR